MESVKLAGIGAHAPQILYPGGRQPPPGPQPAHPPPTSRHEGSPYKTPISPPMGSRAGAGGYAAYPAAGETHVGGGGGSRYIQQPYIYPREPHYIRPASDRPVMLPHGPRRPTILGPYGPYAAHGRADIMPVVPSSPLAVNTTMDSSKRIKLSQPSKQDSARVPLVIDTSDNNHSSRESTYTPQVEAISPTLPSDPRDESPLRSTKDDLLKRIEQVDREIAKAESSIAKLRKKEGELEQAAQKGDGPTAVEEDTKEPKHQSIAQIIYAENRKKAEESHNILVKLIPPTDAKSVLPLYHQPTDTEVYMTNKRQYAGFKRRLMENFKRRQASKNERDTNLTQTYSKLMTEWLKKVEKVENSKKHKEKVAKNRELFEKVFPELRKQREEKERFSRVGARVKSDAEMDEILDGLQEQENEDKKMRAYAVIPPILLEERKRKHRYTNRNGVIEDPITEYKDHKNINIWTEQEKEIFREKYLLNPKNFVVIGSYLERKSVSDCIQFYYSTKKKENYKMLVKRRIRRRQKPTNQPVVEVFGENSTRVLTRGNLAAIKSQQPPSSTRPGSASGMVDSNSLGPSTNTPATSPGPAMGMDLATSVVPATSESSVTSNSCNQEVREKDKENLSASENNKAMEKPTRRERIRNKDDDKTKEAQDSSDEDNAAEHGKGGPHECLVCGTQLEHFGQSRPVGPGQAAQYGLSESHLPANPRVCTNCRCRHLRRRAQCPIPTCPSHKWRGKRLRPLPSRWAELPAEIKDPIIREFQIPPDVTKCCSACHNRILRKLGPEAEEPVDPSRWSEEDVDALRSALREVGCHWSRVAERLPNKTEGQCKSFYFNFKKKYKYDEIVAEYRKSRGKGDGPPTVTDEEESGSSTSSCDEGGTVPPPPATQDSASDTTSAPSPGPAIHHNNIDEKREAENTEGGMKEPLPRHPPPPASVKEDYDSSATASADEGQSCVGRDSPPEVQHLPNPNERPPQPIPTTIGGKTPPPPVPRPSSKGPENPCVGSANVRDLIFDTIERTLEKTDEKPQNKVMPTISNILRTTYVQRSAPPPPPPPVGQEFHRNQLPRFNDPRDGLPLNDNSTFDSQDGQCEGLDLTIRKRERSPPQPPAHQPPSVHHTPAQPPPQSHPPPRPTNSPREIPTVRGGAEVTITSKEPPPRAHAANTSYKPSHEPWGFDPRNKSPAFIPDSRALPHHQPPLTLASASAGPSPHAYTHVRPPNTLPPKLKSSMAPPPPRQHPPPQQVNTSISTPPRIPVKIDKQGPSAHVGSITHGTPVNPPGPIVSVPLSQSGRFDMMKPGIGKEGGSITQGTPMHPDQKRSVAITSIYKESCPPFEARAGSGVEIIPRPALPSQYERETIYRGPRPPISSAPSSTPYYTNYAYTRPAYPEPQISSRQIIAHDYQMSQQMINRRGVEKESRVSPRARDHSPQQDPRDHRTTVGATVSRIIDSSTRSIDPRGLDIRQIEMPRIDRTIDPRLDHRSLDPRVVERINPTTDPRFYGAGGPHGPYPASSQPPSGYPQERVSRPPSSPASVRDPTSSPTSDPAQSPNDFRSPGVSTPTPSRVGVIQRHPTSKPPSHLAPPTSASPRQDERYSPRHLPRGPDTFNEFVNIAVAQPSYPSAPHERREGRPKVPHDTPQPEGFEKVITDSIRFRGGERDKHEVRTAPVDGRIPHPADGRYYDPRKKPPEPENDGTQGFVTCFRKPPPSPTGNSNSRNSNETLTAANLIDAIITHTINHTSGDSGGPNDQRPSRRHETGPHMEMDKRVRSPATAPSKEKEVVMVDDSPDTRPPPNPLNHKEGLGSTHHSAPHHQGSQPKSMHAHMDQIIHREYAIGDGRKMEAPPHMPYARTLPSSSSSLEILRTDGRPYVSSGGPPAVTVSQVGSYEHWKRGPDKEGKDRIDSHSPHRPPPSAQPGGHHIPASLLAPDERQIVRIKQPSPVSPRPDHKRRTPPSAQATSFPGESNSPPSSSAPPLSADPNHTDSNNQWNPYPKRPYPPKEVCQQKEVFDYVRNKIAEVMRTPEIQEGDKRSVDDSRHPQPGLQVSQLQHQQQLPPQHPVSQQNAHYDMEDPLKKRARLETSDRPPSRPRSTGGDMIKERREDAPTRDDVADSPQSGEMVIDESPRDSHPPTSKSGDMSGKISSKGETSERPGYPPVSASSPYSYSYSGFRGHGAPGLGGPGVPPSTTSSTTSSNSSGGRPLQGYEPHVEPVSDED